MYLPCTVSLDATCVAKPVSHLTDPNYLTLWRKLHRTSATLPSSGAPPQYPLNLFGYGSSLVTTATNYRCSAGQGHELKSPYLMFSTTFQDYQLRISSVQAKRLDLYEDPASQSSCNTCTMAEIIVLCVEVLPIANT
jgi:hypothetical protein